MTNPLFCVGTVSSGDGGYLQQWADGDTRSVGYVPPSAYLARQPVTIPVTRLHDDWPWGEVRYLERSSDALWAVCSVRPEAQEWSPAYFSPQIRFRAVVDGDGIGEVVRHVRNIRLDAVGIAPVPASTHLRPLQWFERPSDLLPGAAREVAMRAAPALPERTFIADYQRPTSIDIVDLEPAAETEPPPVEPPVLDLPPVVAGVGRPLARHTYAQPRILRRTFPTTIVMH